MALENALSSPGFRFMRLTTAHFLLGSCRASQDRGNPGNRIAEGLEFKMGVFLVHPGIAVPDQALPKLGGDAAVPQPGNKAVPQAVKSLARLSAAPAFTRGDAARDARLLDESSELTREAACSVNTLSGQVRKNARPANSARPAREPGCEIWMHRQNHNRARLARRDAQQATAWGLQVESLPA